MEPEIRLLQERQRTHDLQHHADIYYLSYPNRMRHFVLHFAKYTGRLAKPLEATGKRSWDLIISDSFIVALAAAEVLHLNLAEELAKATGQPQSARLVEHATVLDELEAEGDEQLRSWWFEQMALHTGEMAKALESLDHMEAFDSRRSLIAGTLGVLRALLVVARKRGLDLPELLDTRWTEIEDKQVF